MSSSWINWFLNELYSSSNVTQVSIIIVIAFVALLIYSGIMYSVCLKIGHTPYEKLTIAYKFDFGDSQMAHKKLNEYRDFIPQLQRFTIMYNGSIYKMNPKMKESYAIGIVVSVNDRAVWENYVKLLKLNGFNFAELPGTDHTIVSKFPYRNYLSVCLAAFKVLPKLRSYIKEKRLCAHPLVEIMDGNMMEFFVPLSLQFDYYVPEAKRYYNMLNLHEQIKIRATKDPHQLLLPMRIPRNLRKSSVASSHSSSTSGISSASQSTRSDTM